MTALPETPTPEPSDAAPTVGAPAGAPAVPGTVPVVAPGSAGPGDPRPTAPAAPVFTAAGEVSATLEVTCPNCGTVSHFSELRKSAEEFCRRCDYPLFWARRRLTGADGEESGAGLRRLPGAGGWRSEASASCPTCREPNRLDAALCVRCGGDMRPAPPPVVHAPAPVIERAPEPEPAPKRQVPWFLVALFVATVVAITLIVIYTQ